MKQIRLVAIILLIIFIFLVANFRLFNSSVSYTYKDINENAIDYKNNTINIDFNKLNSMVKNINNYIDYNDDIKNLYSSIIDYLYNSEELKMYDEKNKKVLEINFNEKSKLNEYFNLNDNTIIKVYFDKNNKDIDLDSIDYKINKEEVTRRNIVETALKEVGKTGETYWNWYGFNHRVEWCCVFVSWVAKENNLLNTKIPKFIWVKKGVDYYKEKDQLKKPSEYTPLPGDIIFFDWNNNIVIDHVGIVEKVEKGYVYTIEGNVNYLYVKEKKYKLNSPYIYAYGVPDYAN